MNVGFELFVLGFRLIVIYGISKLANYKSPGSAISVIELISFNLGLMWQHDDLLQQVFHTDHIEDEVSETEELGQSPYLVSSVFFDKLLLLICCCRLILMSNLGE